MQIIFNLKLEYLHVVPLLCCTFYVTICSTQIVYQLHVAVYEGLLSLLMQHLICMQQCMSVSFSPLCTAISVSYRCTFLLACSSVLMWASLLFSATITFATDIASYSTACMQQCFKASFLYLVPAISVSYRCSILQYCMYVAVF